MLALVAARLVTCSIAVVATAATSLGVGRDLKLCGLSERDLAAIVGEMAAGQRHAVWVASRGMPGIARTLAGQLADLPPGRDALVHLALHTAQHGEFLGVDDGVVRLIEMALARAADDASRARLLARLSRELLGDPPAGPRRRSLADEALMLASRAGDVSALAEVLDARLYALWDPAGAQDRLDAASELIRLGRTAAHPRRDRLHRRAVPDPCRRHRRHQLSALRQAPHQRKRATRRARHRHRSAPARPHRTPAHLRPHLRATPDMDQRASRLHPHHRPVKSPENRRFPRKLRAVGTSLISSCLSSVAWIPASRRRASRRPLGNHGSSRARAAACRGCARAAAGDRSPPADAHRRALL